MGICCDKSTLKSEGENFMVLVLQSLRISQLTFTEFLLLIDEFEASLNLKGTSRANINSNPKSIKTRGRVRSKTIKSLFFKCKTSQSIKSEPKFSINSESISKEASPIKDLRYAVENFDNYGIEDSVIIVPRKGTLSSQQLHSMSSLKIAEESNSSFNSLLLKFIKSKLLTKSKLDDSIISVIPNLSFMTAKNYKVTLFAWAIGFLRHQSEITDTPNARSEIFRKSISYLYGDSLKMDDIKDFVKSYLFYSISHMNDAIYSIAAENLNNHYQGIYISIDLLSSIESTYKQIYSDKNVRLIRSEIMSLLDVNEKSVIANSNLAIIFTSSNSTIGSMTIDFQRPMQIIDESALNDYLDAFKLREYITKFSKSFETTENNQEVYI